MNDRLRVAGILLLAGAWGFIDGFYMKPVLTAAWSLAAGGALLILAAGFDGRSSRGALVDGAAAVSSIVALQIGLQMFLPTLTAHAHGIPGAAEGAAWLFRQVSIEAGADPQGHLLLRTAAGPRAIGITWEAFSLPMVLRILAGLAAVGSGPAVLRSGASLLAFATARLAVLTVILAAGADLSLAYSPDVCLLTFLPLVLLLPPGRRAGGLARAPRGGLLLGASFLVLGGAGAGIWFGYEAPGSRGRGRVLIDESHSNWEWTDAPFTYERLGQKSVYNYALWKSWIEHHHETRVTRTTPTEEDLRHTDVLIVKTPTTPYEESTIDRVEQFVRAGGGLYLIGDHTNLFGMSTVLNSLAAPYGIAFNFDDTFPLDHHETDVFSPPALAPHPVLRGLSRYSFETSCSLEVPWNADHIMIGRRLGAEQVDYGHVNFFGDIHLDASEPFGLFTQAASVRHGKGRVAAFSDSTNFSNFSFLWPGRRALTLNIIDWLNRSRPTGLLGLLGVLCLAVGSLALAAGGVAWGGAGPGRRAVALWIMLAAFLGAAHGASLWSRDRLVASGPGDPLRTVTFDTSLGRPLLDPDSPVFSLAGGGWTSFNTFFVNAARSDLWPVASGDLIEALERSEALVLVNPARSPTRVERQALGRFLESGGRLLVLDSVLNRDGPGASLLTPLGMPTERALAATVAGEDGMALLRRGAPSDGVERHTLSGGGAALSREVARGRVVLVPEASMFSDKGLGGVYSNPDAARRDRYRAQEELFTLLLGERSAVAAGGSR